MTTEDRDELLSFVVRIRIYIHPATADCAISFIHGYERGTRAECDFTTQLKTLLSEKYRISYSSDGWPGQLKRLAKKRDSTWLTTFRNLTLELIVTEQRGNLLEQQQHLLKTRIVSLLERLEHQPAEYLSSYWTDDWLALCPIKRPWFKQLWTKEEWRVIKRLDTLVQGQSPTAVVAK